MMFKKALTFLMAAALCCSAFAGCGQEAEPSSNIAEPQTSSSSEGNSLLNEPGVLPLVTQPVTLNIGLIENTLISDYNDNTLTNWLEEQTGISLEFTLYPTNGDEARQKLELAITAKQDLPDILMGFGLNAVVRDKYGEDGILTELTPYYDSEDDSYYLHQMLQKTEESGTCVTGTAADEWELIKRYTTSPNGSIYVFPNYAPAQVDMWDGRWYINKNWLDKLGMDYPKTTDDLYHVLKAFKTQDPNGNGKQDEIPLVGSGTGWRQQPVILLLNSFLYCPYDYKTVENGMISLAYTQDAYREGLRYIRKLVQEDLFPAISFTQDGAQLKALLDIPADQDSTVGFWVGSPTGLFSVDNSHKTEYSGDFDIIQGPEGVAYTPKTNPNVGGNTYITKDCENPQVAYRFLTFFANEETALRGRFGEKGVNWDYVEDGAKGLYESMGIPALFWQDNAIWGTTNNVIWGGPMMLQPSYMNEGSEASKILNDPLASLGMIAKAVGHLYGNAPKDTVPNLIYTSEELEELSELEATISTYAKESQTRFLTGDLDIEADWDSYLKELDNMGLSDYLKIMQAAYDRMK
ncbi:MAG: extracellular solute-binding protein [Candidatus Merdivicinus sp.]|jgi:putative aldouronate transport system substrate-binding protein